jgi:urea carboxylase-associated protein 2
MPNLDGLSPEQYRTRYLALQEAARARAASTPAQPAAVDALPAERIHKTGSIPAGWYITLRLRRFDTLRITNPAGTPGAALFLWNAEDPSERYNAGDTVKLQWTTQLTTGRLLFSDMGRVLASITADSGAGHDSIIGPNTPAHTAGRNGRDNLRLAAAKFGLTRRDLGPALSLFSKIATDDTGRFHYLGAPPAGAMVALRAEQNLLVALSNTPHALSPIADATGPIDIAIAHTPPGPDDLCRHFTEEAVRGFINTDEVFVP